MAKTIQQQIEDAKKAIADAKIAAAKAEQNAKSKNASKATLAQAESLRKYVTSLESSLTTYNTNTQIYIKKIARGDKLSVLENKEFNNIQSNISKLISAIKTTRTKISAITFPGAVATTPKVTAKVTPKVTGKVTPKVTPAITPRITTGVTPKVTPKVTVKVTPKVTVKVTPKVTVKVTPKVTTKTPSDFKTLIDKTEFWYDLPDYLFKTVEGLDKILVQAVDEGWDNEKFLAAARGTTWWQKNSSALRTRIIDREKYKELRTAGENVDNTEYGQYITKKKNEVKAKARELAGVTLTEEQAQSVAEKIYNGFLDDDPLAINALIVPFIGKVSSIAGTGTGAQNVTAYSGQALQAYQTLQSIAKANGFSIKDILPGISTSATGGDLEQAVLQGLAAGTIDINRVAQDARVLAGQGQPQYVRNLLNQGYDLENVYAPYKNQMAAVLEIDPNMIDLNDATLRSAITDKGDMNLFDFKRQLREDSRWQYTQSARDEVSSGALKVLQDFGFTG